MKLRNDDARYGLVTRLLHWSTALLIIGLIWLGWWMVDLSYFDRWYQGSLSTHRALGLAVFVLGVLTLAWRALSPSPAAVASLKPWEKWLGTAMHHLLFLMVFAIPVSGYLISTSAGQSVDVFGWFSVPALVTVDSKLRDVAIDVHYYLAYTTAVLVLMHAGAACKHQFIDRDGTLARMLWK
ncbi:MAG: cytochrome b [Gammaproteobacteria bacterium]